MYFDSRPVSRNNVQVGFEMRGGMRVLTEEKRATILQAAAAVFQESGFDGASMAQVAARVGGSKSTLYRYYRSKEELFIAVNQDAAKRHILPSLEQLLSSKSENLLQVLTRFGVEALAMVASEDSIKTMRTVISESGRSDIGRRFYEEGQKLGIEALAGFFEIQMDAGLMRRADPTAAAKHLLALFDSETVFPCLMGIRGPLTEPEIYDAVGRAVDIYLNGYSLKDRV